VRCAGVNCSRCGTSAAASSNNMSVFVCHSRFALKKTE
jgi:hypothetical protein